MYVLLLLEFFCFIIYMMTMTPSISAGDSGELIVAVHFLGVAHAPAYPIHTILGKLFTFLPINNIAWRVNLFSAFSAGLFVFLSALVFIKILFILRFPDHITRLAAVFAAIGLGLTSALWSQATITEVYAVSSIFFPAIVLWLLTWHSLVSNNSLKYFKNEPIEREQMATNLPWQKIYGERYLIGFGMLFGLSLGGHHTILMTEFFVIFFISLTMVGFVLLPIGLKNALEDAWIFLAVVLGFLVAWIFYYYLIMSVSSNFLLR